MGAAPKTNLEEYAETPAAQIAEEKQEEKTEEKPEIPVTSEEE